MLDRLVDVGPRLHHPRPDAEHALGRRAPAAQARDRDERRHDVYVLDEPTTGLHMHDVDNLIGLLDRLVDGGRTVIVIEHNLDVVARADWVIDLGPGAGHDGGRVVFEGPPSELVRARARSPASTSVAASRPPSQPGQAPLVRQHRDRRPTLRPRRRDRCQRCASAEEGSVKGPSAAVRSYAALA